MDISDKLSDLSIFDDVIHKKNPLRDNWIDFKEILIKYKINYFYHVTDQSNIESIKKEGLCSWEFCEKENIKINCYGSNSDSRKRDQIKGLGNFVRLSVFKNNPVMLCFTGEQRIPNPCILKIDPRIIYLESTEFSDINATSNNVSVGNLFKNFNKINFELLKNNNINNKQQKQLQAEILVRTWIPCKFIFNLKVYV